MLPAVAIKRVLNESHVFRKNYKHRQFWHAVRSGRLGHALKKSFRQNDYHRSTAPLSSPLHNELSTARMQSMDVLHNHDLLSLMSSLFFFSVFIRTTKCVNQVRMFKHVLFDSPCIIFHMVHLFTWYTQRTRNRRLVHKNFILGILSSTTVQTQYCAVSYSAVLCSTSASQHRNDEKYT